MAKFADIIRPETKRIVAASCWYTGAFSTNFESPYSLRSGLKSPIYISTEQMLNDPIVTDVAMALASASLEGINFDVVAGGEVRGALFGKDLARAVRKPFALIRKKPKDYGAGTQKPKLIDCIDPEKFAGKPYLLTEDLITDGGSKADFIDVIRKAGGVVEDCLVFVDRQQGGKVGLEQLGVKLYAMTDLDTIIFVGKDIGKLNEEQFKSIELYRDDPEAWSNKFLANTTSK